MTGYSLHIGLNRVDPDQYGGWDGKLAGCINDANSMVAIAAAQGFSNPTTLIDDQATSFGIIGEISKLAAKAAAGDLVLITYSGHGGQVWDADGDESDGRDETWVAFDRQIVDDELYRMWSQFVPGVRILVCSDSCHSGTVTREPGQTSADLAGTRAMPRDAEFADNQRRREFYTFVQQLAGPQSRTKIDAGVILLSGCQDNQTSADGAKNGLFTQSLLQVWANGAFDGGYDAFHKKIVAIMPPDQEPNLFEINVGADFLAEHPFTP